MAAASSKPLALICGDDDFAVKQRARQNFAGEIGRVLQVRDDHALDVDAEALKNPVDEIVCEWAFLRRVAQKHADDRAHLRFNVDDENLVVVADEQRAAAVGRQDAANLNRHDFVLHAENLRHNA